MSVVLDDEAVVYAVHKPCSSSLPPSQPLLLTLIWYMCVCCITMDVYVCAVSVVCMYSTQKYTFCFGVCGNKNENENQEEDKCCTKHTYT